MEVYSFSKKRKLQLAAFISITYTWKWHTKMRWKMGHAPPQAGMGRKKLSAKTTHAGGNPSHWGCQNAYRKKKLIENFWLEPIFLISWSGGFFEGWIFHHLHMKHCIFDKKIIIFKKYVWLWKIFFLSLNLGLTARFLA